MKAPGCLKPVKFSTIASGNTFGATFWTDGKREAPMLPDEPWLRKSPGEGVLFWSDQCEEIGVIDPWEDDRKPTPPEWAKLEFAVAPTEADYVAAIRDGIWDTEEHLRYLRVRLWWSGNDPIREGTKDTLDKNHMDNLRALEVMLSEHNPSQRLMRAEVCRELGQFEEASRLLSGFGYPEEYLQAVSQITELCMLGNTCVAALREG